MSRSPQNHPLKQIGPYNWHSFIEQARHVTWLPVGCSSHCKWLQLISQCRASAISLQSIYSTIKHVGFLWKNKSVYMATIFFLHFKNSWRLVSDSITLRTTSCFPVVFWWLWRLPAFSLFYCRNETTLYSSEILHYIWASTQWGDWCDGVKIHSLEPLGCLNLKYF